MRRRGTGSGAPPSPTPPGAGTPPTKAQTTSALDAAGSKLIAAVRRRGLKGLRSTKSWHVALTAPGAGTLQAEVLLRTHRRVLASGTAKFTTATSRSLSLKPSKKARTRLHGVRKAKLLVRVSFAPSGAKASVSERGLTLR